jgi:hypothetical protein
MAAPTLLDPLETELLDDGQSPETRSFQVQYTIVRTL